VPESEAHGPSASPPSEAPSRPTSRLGAPGRTRSLLGGRASVWGAVAALLVLVGSLASVLGARAVARSDAEKAQLAFHLASAEIASTLKLAIQHEEDLVVNASAFVTGNPGSSPADFDRWVESVHAMQRFPELQNIGLVTFVPASRLTAFEARLAASPVRSLGPRSAVPTGPLQIQPPGNRPYYCFAVAGLARSAANYVPPGLDYCAVAPTMITARSSGLAGYAPVAIAGNTTLGVETPVYRGGGTPATASGRRSAFVGWLGELIVPNVVLASALAGHPNLAVVFRYDSGSSHVSFTSGSAPAGAESTRIDLQVGPAAGLGATREGWSVQSFGAGGMKGVFANWNSLALLTGGTLLSVVLGLLVLVLSTGRARALSLVREKTRELSQKNRELSHQALHDALTGLPNRALVLDRAQQLLARGARGPSKGVGALFIDIDGFKHVNDSLGHAAGDQVLRTVAGRLQGAARGQDTVGRLGGDEFVVLVDSAADEATLLLLADRLADALREPIKLDHNQKMISITASIGVAIGQYETPDALLRDADLALYSAKAAGKDRCVLYEASMYTGEASRGQLRADLSAALRDEQFFLLYQPIFDLPSEEVVGAEALIRWRHPERGVMEPDEFIPLAEDTGQIVPIGRWILEQACRQAAVWAEEDLAIGMSVNVSAYQLGRKGFADDVRGALAESGIRPSSLTLEITETTLMRDVPSAREHLEAIKALGVRIAIDDFGTGYASLSQLQRLPVDILKIDMSFIAALTDGEESRRLLEAILGVGRALSLAVIAEGVEEQSQLTTLKEMGCAMAQGFLMAMPGPPEAIETLLGPRAEGRAIRSAAM
jgi:diguanylate cyclase (GGDEF)-like protein